VTGGVHFRGCWIAKSGHVRAQRPLIRVGESVRSRVKMSRILYATRRGRRPRRAKTNGRELYNVAAEFMKCLSAAIAFNKNETTYRRAVRQLPQLSSITHYVTLPRLIIRCGPLRRRNSNSSHLMILAVKKSTLRCRTRYGFLTAKPHIII